MDYNTLTYEYTRLMQKAEQAGDRQEALSCINKATKLMEAIQLVKRDQGILAM